MTAAHRFPVDGHGAPGQGVLACEPLTDFGIQPVGIDPLQHPAKGRFRRGRFPFRTQLPQSVPAETLRPFGNRTKAASSREGRTDSNGHNGYDRMTHPSRFAGVHNRPEQIHQTTFSFQGKAIDIDHPGYLLSLRA
jgi:hypothetical protein